MSSAVRRSPLHMTSGGRTRDIGAVFGPKNVVYEVAATVAEQRDLPVGWLNDAVKGFLGGEDPTATPVLDLLGLRCLAASPRALLALKVLAHQLGLDRADRGLAVAEETSGDGRHPISPFEAELMGQQPDVVLVLAV